MPSSLSEPTSRRPASARKGVERWTADIERRISAETPRGYDAHEKRFARVPWREIPTRTRALEAHEFVNPTAYVVRASDAFVHPGHFLDKAGVLEADRVVREAKRDAREAATRALAERSRADASLRRETVRARSARASRRHESVVEDIVRPRERDAVTGALIDRSGEYRRLGARDRRLGAPPASGKNAPDAPVAVTFRVLSVHDERGDERGDAVTRTHVSEAHRSLGASTRANDDERRRKETASRRDFTTACSKPHPDFDREQRVKAAATEAERTAGFPKESVGFPKELALKNSNWPASLSTLARPRRVTPGERVALVHGPGAAAPSVPSKKTRGARAARSPPRPRSSGTVSRRRPRVHRTRMTLQTPKDDRTNRAFGTTLFGTTQKKIAPPFERLRGLRTRRAARAGVRRAHGDAGRASAVGGGAAAGERAARATGLRGGRSGTFASRERPRVFQRRGDRRRARALPRAAQPHQRHSRELPTARGAGQEGQEARVRDAFVFLKKDLEDRNAASVLESVVVLEGRPRRRASRAPRRSELLEKRRRGESKNKRRRQCLESDGHGAHAAHGVFFGGTRARLEGRVRVPGGVRVRDAAPRETRARGVGEREEVWRIARGFEKHEGAWASEGRIEPRPPTWR